MHDFIVYLTDSANNSVVIVKAHITHIEVLDRRHSTVNLTGGGVVKIQATVAEIVEKIWPSRDEAD